MEIQDIQISLILDQYMAWLDRRRALDLEIASEFITMASQLTQHLCFLSALLTLPPSYPKPLQPSSSILFPQLLCNLHQRIVTGDFDRTLHIQNPVAGFLGAPDVSSCHIFFPSHRNVSPS